VSHLEEFLPFDQKNKMFIKHGERIKRKNNFLNDVTVSKKI
jgi:hypothetical protein